MKKHLETDDTIEPRSVMARLAKTINYWKVDCDLDDYIMRSRLIKCSDKRILQKLLIMSQEQKTDHIQVTVAELARRMALCKATVLRSLRKLVEKGFLVYEKSF